MFGFGKRKGFEPKGFDYVPRFWDPEKEAFEKRIAAAEEKYHGKKKKSTHRVVRFNFRDDSEFVTGGARLNKFDRRYGQVSPWRTLVILAFLASLIYFVFVFEF